MKANLCNRIKLPEGFFLLLLVKNALDAQAQHSFCDVDGIVESRHRSSELSHNLLFFVFLTFLYHKSYKRLYIIHILTHLFSFMQGYGTFLMKGVFHI